MKIAKPRQLFVNLPVADLARSKRFFAALGFEFNPQFTDDNAACMMLSDTGFVMLLTRPFFQGFTKQPITDATKGTEVLVALSCSSRAEVDELAQKALAAGGRTAMPATDHGFMYLRSFYDLDSHHWELFWMDPASPAK
ncbi:MAG: VOC family protein [Planctomycetes bacterium]|nr:VOC family protein [Planctomycetota bacterium]